MHLPKQNLQHLKNVSVNDMIKWTKIQDRYQPLEGDTPFINFVVNQHTVPRYYIVQYYLQNNISWLRDKNDSIKTFTNIETVKKYCLQYYKQLLKDELKRLK